MVKKISSVKSTSVTPQANGLTVKGLVTYEDGSTDSLGIIVNKLSDTSYSKSTTIGSKTSQFTVTKVIKQQSTDSITVNLNIVGTINGKNYQLNKDFTVPLQYVNNARSIVQHFYNPSVPSYSVNYSDIYPTDPSCAGNYWCDLVMTAICTAGIETACAYDSALIILAVCALVCVLDPVCIAGCEIVALAAGVDLILVAACAELSDLGITQAGCKAASGTVCANINCP